MTDSRVKNTKRNISAGMLNSIVSILFPFAVRTGILYVLGEQYVGLSSLFVSILQVLNLAELGFASAVVYNMYKPLAEGNTTIVCGLLEYYKKIYRVIGSFIFVIGLLILPWITNLIHGSWPSEINIYVLYFLYLLNSSLSYFLFAYKNSILNAAQRMDIIQKIHLFVHIVQYIAEFLLIVLFQNFYAFVCVSIVATIGNNIAVSIMSKRYFPQYVAKGNIDSGLKKSIRKQVAGLMIGKLCDTSRNSFDSIVLSSFLGLTIVAIYNNYYYIYSGLYAIMIVIMNAMQASVGNSIAVESKEKNYRDLLKFQFIFSWITGWITVCMFTLYQPFMKLWAGESLMLSFRDMTLFCAYFYAINMNGMRNLYFSGSGLWWNAKSAFVFEALGNLVLNIFLGYFWGVSGVLVATLLTIVVFNYFHRTQILFKQYFETITAKKFYVNQFLYLLVVALCCLVNYLLCRSLDPNGDIVLKIAICLIVPNVMMIAFFHRKKEFSELRSFAQKFLKR